MYARAGDESSGARLGTRSAHATIRTRNANVFEALKLDSEAVAAKEEALRLRARELSDVDRQRYFRAFRTEMKDPDTYAVLNWSFIAGLHHMYLGKWLRGAINLTVLIIGIVLLFGSFFTWGIVIIVGLLCIELMALFRSQTIVAHHNNLVSERILNELGA